MNEERTALVRADILRRMDKMQTRFRDPVPPAPTAETTQQNASMAFTDDSATNQTNC